MMQSHDEQKRSATLVITGCKPSKQCKMCEQGRRRFREVKAGVERFTHVTHNRCGIVPCESQEE